MRKRGEMEKKEKKKKGITLKNGIRKKKKGKEEKISLT